MMVMHSKIMTFSRVALLTVATMLIALPALAADTGLKNPAANASGTTGNPATNPGHAHEDDVSVGSTDTTANYDLVAKFRTINPGGGSGVADSQIYSSFSLNVPNGATIDGIEVIISGYREPSTTGPYFMVGLSGNAGTSWTTYKNTSPLGITDVEYTLGSPTDKWGGSWTAADFSNTNFRLDIIAAGPGTNAEHWLLDSVRVKVYYTLPTAGTWIGETAWAAGSRYVAKGNWATYTAYSANATVTLYAGQTMEAGMVHFSAVVDDEVTITITLNAGWRFKDERENVKIQDYETAPSGNPNPGGFDHKDDADPDDADPLGFEITVPENNFYGVHVDVEWEYTE